MERSFQKRQRPEDVSEVELQREIEEGFSEFLLPSQFSLAAVLKVIRPPAKDEDLGRLLATCGNTLPASYLDFLRESDGAAGCGNDQEGDYLTLWGSEEVVERNASLPIRQDSFELLAIGTDGRDGYVEFVRMKSQDAECWPVVRCDWVSSPLAAWRELAPNFLQWRECGFQLRPSGFLCGGG